MELREFLIPYLSNMDISLSHSFHTIYFSGKNLNIKLFDLSNVFYLLLIPLLIYTVILNTFVQQTFPVPGLLNKT